MNYSTTNSSGTSSFDPEVGYFLLFPAPHGGAFVASCTLLIKINPHLYPGVRGFTLTGALRARCLLQGCNLRFCSAISNNRIIPMLVKGFFVCLKYECLDVSFFVSAIDLSDLLLISSVYPVHRGDNSLSRCPEKNTSHRKPLFSLVSVFSSKLPQILIT